MCVFVCVYVCVEIASYVAQADPEGLILLPTNSQVLGLIGVHHDLLGIKLRASLSLGKHYPLNYIPSIPVQRQRQRCLTRKKNAPVEGPQVVGAWQGCLTKCCPSVIFEMNRAGRICALFIISEGEKARGEGGGWLLALDSRNELRSLWKPVFALSGLVNSLVKIKGLEIRSVLPPWVGD